MKSSFDKGIFDTEGRKRVVVCGSREFDDPQLMKEKLDTYLFFLTDPIIVTGGNKLWSPAKGRYTGADYHAQRYAEKKMYRVEIHWPDWNKYKKKAGPIRNREMAKVADFVIAFWDGESRGTLNMIQAAKDRGVRVKIVRFDKIAKRKKKKG